MSEFSIYCIGICVSLSIYVLYFVHVNGESKNQHKINQKNSLKIWVSWIVQLLDSPKEQHKTTKKGLKVVVWFDCSGWIVRQISKDLMVKHCHGVIYDMWRKTKKNQSFFLYYLVAENSLAEYISNHRFL